MICEKKQCYSYLITDTVSSFYFGASHDSGMDDKGIAISKVKACLNWINNDAYVSYEPLRLALKCLKVELFGAAIIYFGTALEAELCYKMNKGIENKTTQDLLKEAVKKKVITTDIRDEINGIMWLRDAHAHPQGTLNKKTWARLKTIAKEYGIPTALLSTNQKRLGHIINFNSACLARKIAEKMNDLLAKLM